MQKSCSRHGRLKELICCDPVCKDVFICQHKECVERHIHSKQLINLPFLQHVLEDPSQISTMILNQLLESVQQYFQSSIKEFTKILRQYKAQTINLVHTYSHQIAPSPLQLGLVLSLQGELLYSSSKAGIIEAWKALTLVDLPPDSQISFLIKELNSKISKKDDLFAKIRKQYLSRHFNFSKCSFKQFGSLQINKDELVTLMDLLDNKKISISLSKLLYDAKEFNFDARSFHSKCDSQNQTLVIARNQNGYLFGGYTSKSWSGSGYLTDDKSFLFSVTKNTVFQQKADRTYSIYRQGYTGPTWGGGHDLSISNLCDNNANSYSNINFSYSCENIRADEYPLTGSRNFRISNYIVLSIQQ